MTTVDETLRALIEAFPCSYPDRTQALHQVLVVVGAGYEWRGGEVVERHPDPRNCLSVHGQFTRSAGRVRRLRESGVDAPQEDLDAGCPAEQLRPRAEELARTSAPLRRDAYQASTGSLLLTVPRDVTADWARAAREIAAVVGPLWAARSAYRKAFESSLTPSQRAYVDGERTEALRLLGVRFGRSVLAGEQR